MRDELRRKTIAALILLLRVEDPAVQRRVCHELGRRQALEAAPSLVEALDSPVPEVVAAAADALAQLSFVAAGSRLLSLLADNSRPVQVRDTCAYALGRIGFRAAIPDLMRALWDASPSVRLCAVSALASLRADGADEVVRMAKEVERDARVLRAMEQALALLPHRSTEISQEVHRKPYTTEQPTGIRQLDTDTPALRSSKEELSQVRRRPQAAPTAKAFAREIRPRVISKNEKRSANPSESSPEVRAHG